MRKIDTLLDLWELKCKICSNQVKVDCEKTGNWKTWIKQIANVDSKIDFALDRMRSPEEFSTQILYKLFKEYKTFREFFLDQIGLKNNNYDIKAEYHKPCKDEEEEIEYENEYDISFWDGDKLVCVVENKLGADFSEEIPRGNKKKPQQLKRYHTALVNDKADERTLVTLTMFDVTQNKKVTSVFGEKPVSEQEIWMSEEKVKYVPLLWYNIIQWIEKNKNDNDQKDLLTQVYNWCCYIGLNNDYFLKAFSNETRNNIVENIDKIIQKILKKYDNLASCVSYKICKKERICNFTVYHKEKSLQIYGGGQVQYGFISSLSFIVTGYQINGSCDAWVKLGANLLILKDNNLHVSDFLFEQFKGLDNTRLEKYQTASSKLPWNDVIKEEDYSKNIWAENVSYPGNVGKENDFYSKAEEFIEKAIKEFKEKING